MAFDAASKKSGSKATVNPVSGFGAAAAARSHDGIGYQAATGGGSYSIVVDGLEREIRKLVQLVGTLRKLVAQIGTKADNQDLRARW